MAYSRATPMFSGSCGYTTNRKFNVSQHQSRKNKCTPLPVLETVHEPELKLVEPEPANPCQCTKCNKIFSSKVYVKKHEMTCNGLHILQCPTCLKFCLDK